MVSSIVAFPKIEDAKGIRNLLMKYGFTVAGVYTSGAQVLQRADELGDCIVVCGYRLADMLFLDLNENLPSNCRMLLLSGKPVGAECEANGILCLAMPLKPRLLIDSMSLLMEEMEQLRRRRKAKPRVRSEDEQKWIDRAKELLQENNHMSEEEAHRYLQRCSMESGNTMVESAQMVLSLYQ